MELFRLFGTIMVDNSKANDTIKDTEKKAEDAATQLGEMATQAGAMALSVAAAGAAFVTAIGVKSVMAADDLKKSMNTLQAQTGATDEQMKGFEESTKRLYEANYGQSFDDIARSMSEIARTTGLSGAELENTTKNALNLRDTFDFGVNESARAANSLIKNFGITAEQAYTLIAQGAQQGANKNGDLLDTLNEYSVQFKSLGFSAEQFTGVLIDGAANGAFSIDKVGDAIKEFNIRAKDGSKTSATAFEQLGMNAGKMTQAFAAGGTSAQTAFQQVASELAKVEDPVKKNTIGVSLFGTQFEDLEAKAIEALGNIQAQTNQNADTLNKINDLKTESFGAQLSKLGRQLQTNFFIPVGQKLIPLLEELMGWFDENKKEIQNGLGKAVSVVGAIFNGFAKVLKFVANNMKIILPLVIGLTAAFVAQKIVGLVTTLYTLFTTATKGMTAAQIVLNAVMKANPFGLIATAIGLVIAAGVALVMNWDKVKSALIGVWDSIKSAAISVWEYIMGFFQTTFGKIVAFIGGPITIGLAIIANWEKIKSSAVTIWGAVVDFFKGAVDKIKGFFQGMADKIKTVFDSLVGFVKVPLNLIIDGLNFFIKGYESMLNGVISAINAIPDIEPPSWLGGGEYGIPDIKPVKFGAIPKLAEGGTIKKAGMVMVGEQGPELLSLPNAAQVTPLDKVQQPIQITINNPTIMNDRDAEKFGDLLVRYLKTKGINPRGV